MTEAEIPTSTRLRLPFYLSYVVVLGMVTCFGIAIIQFEQWLIPTWDPRGMLIVCVLAALEAAASHRIIQRFRTAQNQFLFYRITEWIILLVILKLFTELVLGPANFLSNLQLWPVRFPENVINTRFFLTILPFAIIWGVSNLFDNDLMLLGSLEEAMQEEGLHTTSVRNLILRRFLNVGMFVVVLAGIPPQTLIAGPQPAASNSAPVVVMYFLLGIVLMSLTRYGYLSSLWRQSRVNIPVQIPRRWFAYSAVVIVVLGTLIFVLPNKYGMGLLATLNVLLGLVERVLAFIFAIIFLIINSIARLLTHIGGPVPPQPITPQQVPPLTSLLPSTSPSAIVKMVESILFWTVLIGLILVALRQYILFNKDLADEIKHFRPFRWLALFWKRITASVKKVNKSVGIFVHSSLQRLRSIGRTPVTMSDWEYINPRRLDTRQKIIFYYLALLRRAGDAGLPRRDGQTPYEYAERLNSVLVEGKEGVETLTGSFVEARYSLHKISREESHRVESLWESIRRLLRNVRKARQAKTE